MQREHRLTPVQRSTCSNVLVTARTFTASNGHRPMSAKNSADAEPAKKMPVWYFFAFSGPAMSAYFLLAGAPAYFSRNHQRAWYAANIAIIYVRTGLIS